jgi:hypothetical protein
VSRLLATGLFGKARPAAATALRGEAPQFGAVKPEAADDEVGDSSTLSAPPAAAAVAEDISQAEYAGEVTLQMVPPLGGLKFVVEPRTLPLISSMEVRLDSSLREVSITLQQLQHQANELLAAAAAERKGAAAAAAVSEDAAKTATGTENDDKPKEEAESSPSSDSSLPIYLKARAQLAALFPEPSQVVVSFTGVESGRVEVLVRARRAADPAFVSGLEPSALGGEGVNIESFRPQRSSVQLSPGMLLPAEAAERLAAARAARQAARVLAPAPGWQQR